MLVLALVLNIIATCLCGLGSVINDDIRWRAVSAAFCAINAGLAGSGISKLLTVVASAS